MTEVTMGTWGTGICEDDLAADVKNFYLDLRKQGIDVTEATDKTLTQFATAVADSDERSVFFLALAASQIDDGTINPNIKERVQQLIENGEAMTRWSDTTEDDRQSRKRAITELQNKMM